jgi:D-alanyl-D-alanine carboxypeptidase
MQGVLRVRSLAVVLVFASLLAACGHSGGGAGSTSAGYVHHGWAPPGPASDPWGPYIKEAAARFHLPEQWIRAVMRQESGGHQFLNGGPTTSSAGATGLMQVMPATYDILAARYGLGSDPYDPHDNIMAGTAYIREMYERYGSPGFLAAYNAGPGRMDAYLAGRGALPVETVNYMAAISPRLGPADAGSSPAPGQYAAIAPQPAFEPIPPSYVEPVPDDQPAVVQTAAQMIAPVAAPIAAPAPQTDSALGEDRTVVAAALPAPPPPAFSQPVVQPAVQSVPMSAPMPVPPRQLASAGPLPLAPPPMMAARGHQPEYRLVAGTPYADGRGASVADVRPAAIATTVRTMPGDWGIQVGAYASPALARLATEGARQGANLQGVRESVQPFDRPGVGRVFRARLTGFSGAAAHEACSRLRTIGSDCFVVPPGNSGA